MSFVRADSGAASVAAGDQPVEDPEASSGLEGNSRSLGDAITSVIVGAADSFIRRHTAVLRPICPTRRRARCQKRRTGQGRDLAGGRVSTAASNIAQILARNSSRNLARPIRRRPGVCRNDGAMPSPVSAGHDRASDDGDRSGAASGVARGADRLRQNGNCRGLYFELVQRGSRVLFLAHRRELITQASRKLHEAGCDHGVWLPGYPLRPAEPVQVASIATLHARAIRSGSIELPRADLVIVDEAHHSRARTYQRLIASYPGRRSAWRHGHARSRRWARPWQLLRRAD